MKARGRILLGLALAVLVLVPVNGVATVSLLDGEIAYHGPPARDDVQIGINTTYRYEFLYNLTRLSDHSPLDTHRWIPILGNRTRLSLDGKIHQQEFILDSLSRDPATTFEHVVDAKGNEYYYVEVNPAIGSSWTLRVVGNLTLRETTWVGQPAITTAAYNVTDDVYLRYTAEEEYINKSFPLIQGNASLLNATSVFETVKNVYEFVSTYLEYEVQPAEYGAEWAIVNGRGDCTEFSYLMVALLRACGIPARVLRGNVIARSSLQGARPDFRAAQGARLDMRATFQNGANTFSNLTGHAWVEYFIPGHGWISADPTWANAGTYLSRVDNVHVPYTTGVWIGDGVDPALPVASGITEKLATIPFPIYVANGLKHDVYYAFTVVHQEVPRTIADMFLDFIMENPVMVAGIAFVVILLIFTTLLVKARRASKDDRDYSRRVRFSDY